MAPTNIFVPGVPSIGRNKRRVLAGLTSASLYLGQVATRTLSPTGKVTSNKQFNARNRHKATDNITSLQLVLANWFTDTGDFGGATWTELNSGCSPTITASVEYPAGTFTQVKFSGATSVSPSDGATVVSDAATVSIPQGAFFWTRIYWTSATGILISYPGSTNWVGCDTSVGEAMMVAASGLADLTMGGTITESNSGQFAYKPVGIIAQTRRPSVLICGDSRAFGFGDGTANAAGDYGEVAPSLGAANIGYINVAIQGDQAVKFVASHAKRGGLGAYCSHIYSEYGVNDLDQTQSAPQLLSNQQTIGGYFPGKPFYIATLSPHANGSNTAPANSSINTQRVNYNTTLRAGGISGVTAVFDTASITESALNSGLWTATYSTDFLHANSTGTAAVKNSGVINTSLIHRP